MCNNFEKLEQYLERNQNDFVRFVFEGCIYNLGYFNNLKYFITDDKIHLGDENEEYYQIKIVRNMISTILFSEEEEEWQTKILFNNGSKLILNNT